MKYHCNFSFIQSRMLRRMLLNPSQKIPSNQNNSKKKKKIKENSTEHVNKNHISFAEQCPSCVLPWCSFSM